MYCKKLRKETRSDPTCEATPCHVSCKRIRILLHALPIATPTTSKCKLKKNDAPWIQSKLINEHQPTQHRTQARHFVVSGEEHL